MIGLGLLLVRHGGVLRGQYLFNRQKRIDFAAKALVFITISLEELRLHLRSLAYDFRQDQIPLLLLLQQELLRDCNDSLLILIIPAPFIYIYHHLLLLEYLWTTVCITSKEVILSDW